VLSVAQLDAARLSVKAGRFRAVVACAPDAVLANVAPDPQHGEATNALRDALTILAPFVTENGTHVATSSVLLRAGGTAAATTGFLLIEVWHGVALPCDLVVPKVFVAALCATKKDILCYGYSATSFTVYFTDKSWVKTQLWDSRWPDVDRLLNSVTAPKPLPDGFFVGLSSVLPFIVDNRVRLVGDRIQSHIDEGIGASYTLDTLNGRGVYNAKFIKMLDGVAKSVDFSSNNTITYFYGDGIRGAISKIQE
jgi:hypothetical protein